MFILFYIAKELFGTLYCIICEEKMIKILDVGSRLVKWLYVQARPLIELTVFLQIILCGHRGKNVLV